MTTHLFFLAALGIAAVLSGTVLAYRIEAAIHDVNGPEGEPDVVVALPAFLTREAPLMPEGKGVFGCGWIERRHCQWCERCGHWVLRIVYADAAGCHEDWDPSPAQALRARGLLRTAEWTRWLPFVPSDRGGFHVCRPVVPAADVLEWKRAGDEDCRGRM